MLSKKRSFYSLHSESARTQPSMPEADPTTGAANLLLALLLLLAAIAVGALANRAMVVAVRDDHQGALPPTC